MMTPHFAAGVLLVLLAAAAPAQTTSDSRPFFSVLDYGAHRDGSASSTGAFRAAIQACAKAGGGTVFIPAGRYTSGAIELVSNLTLWFGRSFGHRERSGARHEGTRLPCRRSSGRRSKRAADLG